MMDKRDFITGGIGIGTISLIMAGTGGKSVFASEPDWRDELLSLHTGYEIYHDMDVSYPTGDAAQRYVKTNTISMYYWETRNWVVLHVHQERDFSRFIVTHDYNETLVVNERRDGDGTEFKTLKEAFLFAKELRAKYYT
jgi:hypothetical protein